MHHTSMSQKDVNQNILNKDPKFGPNVLQLLKTLELFAVSTKMSALSFLLIGKYYNIFKNASKENNY